MIVAAAVSAGGLGRWGLAALAVVCLVLVQSADSRAGTVGLVVLLWLVASRILWGRRQRFAIGAPAAGVGTAALIGYLMLSRPHISLTDSTRWNNVARGLTAWTDSGWAIVPGRGTSSVWRSFAAEMSTGGLFARSPWGELLWHPHSTLLGVLVRGFPAAVIWWAVALYIVPGVVRTRPGSG